MHYQKWFRLTLILTLAALLAFSAVTIAHAMEFDSDGSIAAGEVIDDDVFLKGDPVVIDGTIDGNLFANGPTVTFNGVVEGDLFVNAAVININGQVHGNVVLVGQSITYNGITDGSLFVGASSLTLGTQAQVAHNLYAGGFSIETASGSQIGRDAAIGGYQAILSGDIARDIYGNMSAFYLNGKIGRDVQVNVGKPDAQTTNPIHLFSNFPAMQPGGLHISAEAAIGGKLTYTSEVEQPSSIAITPDAGIQYKKSATSQPLLNPAEKIKIRVLGMLRALITLLILGALIVWKRPAELEKMTKSVRRFLPALGWGFGIIIGGIAALLVAGFLLVIGGILIGITTLGELSHAILGLGFPVLGLAATLFWLLVAYGSKLVVANLAGRWVYKRLAPGYAGSPFWPLSVGVVGYVLIRMILPFGLDILFGAIITLVGVGAMWLMVLDQRAHPEAFRTTGEALPPSAAAPAG